MYQRSTKIESKCSIGCINYLLLPLFYSHEFVYFTNNGAFFQVFYALDVYRFESCCVRNYW